MSNPMNTSRRRVLEPSASLYYSSPPPSPIPLYTDNKEIPSSPALSLARPRSPSPHSLDSIEPVIGKKRKLEQLTSPRAIKRERCSTEELFQTPSSPPLSPALLRASPNVDAEKILGKKRMFEQQTPTRATKRQKYDAKDLPLVIHKQTPPPSIFFPADYRSTLAETHNEQTPRTPKHHSDDEYPAPLHCTADKEWAPRKKQRMKSRYRYPALASSSPITRLVERRRATKEIKLHRDITDTLDTKTPSHKPSLKRTPQKPKTDLPLTTPRPGKRGAGSNNVGRARDCMHDTFDEDDAEYYLRLYQELVVAREEDIKVLRVLVGTIMKSVGGFGADKKI